MKLHIVVISLLSTVLTVGEVSAQTHFQTVQVLELDQKQGSTQWRQTLLNRVALSHWYFYNDGSFKYAPDDYSQPVTGGYTHQNGTYTFKGERNQSFGNTGSNNSAIEGRLFKRGDVWYINQGVADLATTAWTNITGSVGSNSSSIYTFVAQVR